MKTNLYNHSHYSSSFAHGHQFGILNTDQIWMPKQEEEIPEANCYYEIDFGHAVQVKGIIIQGNKINATIRPKYPDIIVMKIDS